MYPASFCLNLPDLGTYTRLSSLIFVYSRKKHSKDAGGSTVVS